ncbi:MAG: DNA mismatch repair endonuclease MutL [Geobacteraceae bacterium]|nr:DNA mismatch repair endonuclease MutL [Geobacteraceae bacterium]
MSAKVRILPEQLANKIAAGEVVERPASVVKELVENSLDAGASEIVVEIEDGGKRLIRVTDNGSGMSREDALMSLERHATSKISLDSDLFSLNTLGFRGEALPSIASVSRFSISTRVATALEGVEIYAEGGKIKDLKACGIPVGTSIAVRNIFFNTPARLKFMRSKETESGHVNEIINRLALSRPDVRFFYKVDEKQVMTLLNGDIASRAKEVLGKSLINDLYRIDAEDNEVALEGLVGSPAASRSTSAGIYTFINGRYVRDRVVQHAIMQAYRNILERGRYPVLVLFITLSPEDVDVNVHPTKHEVRFREQSKVHQIISGLLEAFLRKSPWLVQSTPGSLSLPPRQSSPSLSRIEEVREALLKYSSDPAQTPLHFPAAQAKPARSVHSDDSSFRLPNDSATSLDGGYFSSLRIIGQLKAAYILCEDDNGLVLIDQHAAHERVVFEELKQGFNSESMEGQQLLFPETVEFMPDEAALLKEQGDVISRLGFELEHFGGSTWILNCVPQVLAGHDYKQALRDVIEEMTGIGSSRLIDEKLDDMLATIACHSVVRGEWHLGVSEIGQLFARMNRTDFSGHCPHGRPAVARIALRDVEKLFNRT